MMLTCAPLASAVHSVCDVATALAARTASIAAKLTGNHLPTGW